MKILKRDIGRWLTVKWDDVGKRDCLLVDIRDDGSLRVFELGTGLTTCEKNQVTEIRNFLKTS